MGFSCHRQQLTFSDVLERELRNPSTVKLLRMSDLIAMQPNLNIPLYLVAPDERRDKVIAEVNRPTFSRLTPPMNRICSYISFSTLRQSMEIARAAGWTAYLKPDFLQALAEPCLPDEA